jgi:hypothetical protein
MPTVYDLIWRFLFQSFLAAVVVFACVGFAVGIGLIVSSARTLRTLQRLNRWVSTRGALKSMEIPRDTDQDSHRHGRRIGWALIAGGLFSCVGLLVGIDPAALARSYAKGDMVSLVVIVTGTLKWFLFVGSVAGVVVGALLGYSPEALARLESRSNRWISSRRGMRGADDMRLTLDQMVEAHPGPSGWILACTTLGAVLYALLLFARH